MEACTVSEQVLAHTTINGFFQALLFAMIELSSLHSQLEKWKNGMMEYWVSIPPHSH